MKRIEDRNSAPVDALGQKLAFSLRYRNRLMSDRFSDYNRVVGLVGAARSPRGQQIFDEMVSERRRK